MEQTKKCTQCGVEKALSEYAKNSSAKSGMRCACKSCDAKHRRSRALESYNYQKEYKIKYKEELKLRDAEYYRKNVDRIAEYQREYARKNAGWVAEYQRGYRTKYKAEVAARARKYRQGRVDAEREYHLEYARKNADRIAEYKRKYWCTPAGKAVRAKDRVARTFLKKAVRLAETYADEIKAVYALAKETAELAGVAVHVDHIIPLCGVTEDGNRVSGLHVPWNLNPIYAKTNLKKHNKARQCDALAFINR